MGSRPRLASRAAESENPKAVIADRERVSANFAWRAIELGRPLLGMRVGDFFTVVRKTAGEYKKVYAVGLGTAGLVALHAAALGSSDVMIN